MEYPLGGVGARCPQIAFPVAPAFWRFATWVVAAATLGFVAYAVETAAGAQTPQAQPVVTADAPAELPARAPTLGVAMRRALEYTAKRYRLSPLALEPVFVAAERSARELGLDPLLIIAVIGVESGFNPFAESVVGAQGLMQVIPRYHADKLPREVRAGPAAAAAFFDPVINVRVGVKALYEFIRDNGDVVDGLQQFAGAPNDPDQVYAEKVLMELERLENLDRHGRPATS